MDRANRTLLLVVLALAVVGAGNAAYVTHLVYQVLPSTQAPLICDINSVFSCSRALELTQSYVFGIPSCTIALFVYPVMALIALLGYFGKIRWHFPALALLALGGMGLNGYVLAIESVYNAFCLFCIACGVIITSIFGCSLAGHLRSKKLA